MNTDIEIVEVKPYFIDTKCRVPLKFGAVVVEQLTFCRTRVTVRNKAGRKSDGWGGIFLMDSWCFPTPKIAHDIKDQAMKELVNRFSKLFEDYDGYAHPVDMFLEVERSFESIRKDITSKYQLIEELPELCVLVCASSIDAAVHDAFGKVNGICTYDGYGRSQWNMTLADTLEINSRAGS
jgi:hypothetical protein